MATVSINVSEIRRQFPVTQRVNFLDNASLTPLPQVTVNAVTRELQERCDLGVNAFWTWMKRIEETRGLIAKLIGASAPEIAFTQNTSEGLNIVANGIDWKPGDNVVINDLEYFPNVYPWINQRHRGVEVRIVRHRGGLFDVTDLRDAMDRRTRVLAISHVAWANGLRQDLASLAEICRPLGAYLCVDAIQSVGAIPLDLSDRAVDFLAAGGQKWLFAPTGTGFFYCRADHIQEFSPSVVGWQSDDRPSGSQAYAFRDDFMPGPTARRFNHGNSNVAGLHGLHASLTYLGQIGWRQVMERTRALTDRLIEASSSAGFAFNGPVDAKRGSTIINLAVPDIARIMAGLKERKVQVSSRIGGVRVSPAFYNTEEEIDHFLDCLKRLSR